MLLQTPHGGSVRATRPGRRRYAVIAETLASGGLLDCPPSIVTYADHLEEAHAHLAESGRVTSYPDGSSCVRTIIDLRDGDYLL